MYYLLGIILTIVVVYFIAIKLIPYIFFLMYMSGSKK
jgi:hypothetical protein